MVPDFCFRRGALGGGEQAARFRANSIRSEGRMTHLGRASTLVAVLIAPNSPLAIQNLTLSSPTRSRAATSPTVKPRSAPPRSAARPSAAGARSGTRRPLPARGVRVAAGAEGGAEEHPERVALAGQRVKAVADGLGVEPPDELDGVGGR